MTVIVLTVAFAIAAFTGFNAGVIALLVVAGLCAIAEATD